MMPSNGPIIGLEARVFRRVQPKFARIEHHPHIQRPHFVTVHALVDLVEFFDRQRMMAEITDKVVKYAAADIGENPSPAK